MRRLTVPIGLAIVAALTLAVQAQAIDISKLLQNKEGPDKFQIIRVADLSKVMTHPNTKVWIFDANHASTREKFGIIPGAHLLSSYDNYDIAAELPADKNARLVFYCADLH